MRYFDRIRAVHDEDKKEGSIPTGMTSYTFETREFAVSDAGIHLLSDRYNYRTIHFLEIKRIIIGKGKEIPNWIGVFILGTAILYAAVDFSLITIDGFAPTPGASDS